MHILNGMHTRRDLIGSTEASRILNVAVVTVTRWVSEGSLPTVGKLPGKNGAIVFDRSAIESVAAKRHKAAS